MLFSANKSLITNDKSNMTYEKSIGIELGKPKESRVGVETSLTKKAFWIGFTKTASEDGDPYLDVFYRPDSKGPLWKPDWGVKLDTSMDARDIGEGQALMFGQNAPESDVLPGRGYAG